MIFGPRRVSFIAGANPVSYDTSTIAWVAAVVSAGGTVSPTQEGYVDTLIKGLKTNSLFTIMDGLWLIASENTYQSNIDITHLRTWTFNGSGTFSSGFTSNQGWAGDGSTNYLDTGIDLSSFTSGSYSLNSAHWQVYDRTNNPSAGGTYILGQNKFQFDPPANGGITGALVNSSGGGSNFTNSNPNNSQGYWIGTTFGSNSQTIYLNGSSAASLTATSGLPPVNGSTFLISSHSLAGIPIGFNSDQVAIVGWGGGITSGQVATMSTLINSYMTSLGANVY